MVSSSGDVFSEVIIRRKTTPVDIVVRIICGIVIFVIVGLFLMGLFAAMPGLFIFALLILVAIYFIIRFQKVEYEYCYSQGDLTFDQLTGDFRRKRKLAVSFETLDIIAKEGSDEAKMKEYGDTKVYDFSSRNKSSDRRYVFLGNDQNGRIKIIFEPSDKMLRNMYLYSPSKVKPAPEVDLH